MARGGAVELDDGGSDHSVLGRFLLWAGLAAVALGLAALAAQTQTGAQRLAGLMGRGSATTVAARSAALVAPPRPSEAEAETRRLAEQVRLLAADRDRLLARVDALERNVEATGSIPRDTPAPPQSIPAQSGAPPSLPPGWSLGPNNIPPGAGVPPTTFPNASPSAGAGAAASTANEAAQPGTAPGGLIANEQAAGSVATKTEFAVDIGGDATFEGLRALWASLRSSHATLLDGLRPVVAVREGGRPGALELRLVVGPLNNASAAARLCASLGAAGVACQPTIFDGQRFALR